MMHDGLEAITEGSGGHARKGLMKSHVTCRLISFGEDDFKSYWFVADFLTSFLGLTRQNIKIGTENLPSSSSFSSSPSSGLPLTHRTISGGIGKTLP